MSISSYTERTQTNMQQAAPAILSSMCKPSRTLSNKVHNAISQAGNPSYAGHQSRDRRQTGWDERWAKLGCLVLSLTSRQWGGILNDLVSILEICRFRYESHKAFDSIRNIIYWLSICDMVYGCIV